MILRRIITTATALAVALAAAGCASEVSTDPTGSADPTGSTVKFGKVRIGIAAPSATLILPFMAEGEGLLEKHGLTDVEISFVPGPQLVPALAGGAFDVAIAAAPAADLIALSSDRVKLLASWLPTSGQYLVAAPDIASVAELKGRNVAINGSKGGSSSMLMDAALRKVGLTFDDVNVSVLQDSGAQVSAYASGQVDAMVTFPPNTYKVMEKRPGSHIIDDLLDVPFPSGQVSVNSAWAEKNSDAVVGLLRGLNDALVMWRADPEKAKALISQKLKLPIDDPMVEQLYAHSVKVFAKELRTIDKAMEAEVFKTILANGFEKAVPEAVARVIAPEFGQRALTK